MTRQTNLHLIGRIILTGSIELVTGLHIGAKDGPLSIGGVEQNPIIRNMLDGRPYIPGSSLKGKMRSLSEKSTGAPLNEDIGSGKVWIHVAKSEEQYNEFWVNPVFGVPANTDRQGRNGQQGFDIPAPNRLVVRDVPLDPDSAAKLDAARTDTPYAEIKAEVGIDRVTAFANPRTMERVPAGAIFSPMELVFSAYLPGDGALFEHVLDALELVEDDYLGGQGTRGSGKVRFTGLKLQWKAGKDYAPDADPGPVADELAALKRHADLNTWLSKRIPPAPAPAAT